METDKMSAEGFASQIWGFMNKAQATAAIASRDAYRERQALEAAAECADLFIARREGKGIPGLRAEILGKPGFVPGQLVIRKAFKGVVFTWPRVDYPDRPDIYEPFLDRDGKPVFAKVDAEGRAIVEDET
jgi:hypothetical protein